MKVAVIHHSLNLSSGGERVCMSLLRALDRTRHEAMLRCVAPPIGVKFAGASAAPPPPSAAAAAAPTPPLHSFKRVRLALSPRQTVRGGTAPDYDAEARSLFGRTGCDVAVVTDGGFVMERTDAPRVVWYCNSALVHERRVLALPRPRHPRNMLRTWRLKRPFRRTVAAARAEKVEIVPNSEYTRTGVSAALGCAVRGPTVHPPVDLRRFSALRGMQKERRTATVARFGPEKNLGSAVRIMREAGGGYDIVGNDDGHPNQLETIEAVRRAASDAMRLHVNAGQNVLEGVVGGAKAYLQTSEETFGMAVVEAIAAGCVPVVPDHTAHPETVPFAELRYRTEAEAARIVRGALDGRYDGLLPALQRHAEQFSEEAFQEAMLGMIESGRDA